MLPVQGWPPGSPGRSLSPFSVPWLVDLRRHPLGMTIPKGVWMVSCSGNAGVVMRVNLGLAVELVSQPALITSIPPIQPLPMLPPIPRPPCPPGPPQDFFVNHTIVAPHHTGTVWSDGWSVRLCGCGRAMLIKASQ